MHAIRSGITVLGLLALAAAGAAAQGAVIQGSSSIQLLDMRPVVTDSVPFAATDSVSAVLRSTPNGVVTTCVPGDAYCFYYRSAARANLVALMQNLDVTAWGFRPGLSFHAQLRARTAEGDARDLWPQATQTFDVLDAYVEYDRSPWNARLGRQWVSSGLGVFNFDGAAVTVHPLDEIGINLYGGGTLVQGLDRPLDAAVLAPVEDIPPVDRSFLVGGQVQIRPSADGVMRFQYQREVRSDRGALYSERGAMAFQYRFPHVSLGGLVTRDFATETFNDVDANLAFDPWRGIAPRVEFRHYVPYFDLWTIWGAFSPVGYNEGTAAFNWASADARLALGLTGGYRSYDNTYTGVAWLPLRTSGWRVGATGALRASDVWSVQGSYDMDINFGASSTDGDVSVRWQPSDRGSLALHGTAFQNIYEFTVGEGRVVGAGLEGAYQLRPDLRFVGDAMLYHHTGKNQPDLANWDQRRASVRLEWRLGGEPGSGGGAWTVGPVRRP
ncbi:MAG: hypothetical protein KGJ70_12360 [Gemmatimonadota bacterium]|nr:hypothetical protein [Gemmatimonadota bacterium]